MRRKIAKRKRREIIKRATITAEYWEKKPEWKRKECCYVVKCECNGWKIVAPDYDELEAYKAALECIKMAEEEPYQRADNDEQV